MESLASIFSTGGGSCISAHPGIRKVDRVGKQAPKKFRVGMGALDSVSRVMVMLPLGLL